MNCDDAAVYHDDDSAATSDGSADHLPASDDCTVSNRSPPTTAPPVTARPFVPATTEPPRSSSGTVHPGAFCSGEGSTGRDGQGDTDGLHDHRNGRPGSLRPA